MINCIAEVGLHRLEFIDCSHGITEYRCFDCGETIIEYQDNIGG